jgi:hypothetical protein
MGPEITFKVDKPSTEQEIKNFKLLKADLKVLLKKGKLKVVEKYANFTFSITDYTADEQKKINEILKKQQSTG